MYLRSIFELYGATAINFLLLIFRDWYLLAYVESHREYLSLIYAASVAGAFSVNAVLLGQVFHRRNSLFFALLTASTLLFLVIAVRSKTLSQTDMLIGSVVPALWAIGARISRASFESGFYFFGRVREGGANLLLISLVAMNFSLVAIPISILLSNAILYGINKLGTTRRNELDADFQPALIAIVSTLFYSSIFTALINYWALGANLFPDAIFGMSAPEAVRFSIYFFQVLSVPVVLVSNMRIPRAFGIWLLIVTWACVLALLALLSISPTISVVLAPIAAGLGLFAAVGWMNVQRNHSA